MNSINTWTKRLLLAAAVVIGSAAMTLAASAQTEIRSSVIASGGGVTSGGGIMINGTIGQPIIGVATSGTATVFQGFWFTPSPGKPGASSVATEHNASTGIVAEAYPNPCSVGSVLRIALGSSSKLRAGLYDLMGKEIAVLYDGESEGGELRIRLDVGSIPAGQYMIRIAAGTVDHTVPLLVIR